MQHEDKAILTPEFLRKQLKLTGNLDLSDQSVQMFDLFAGLIATMNMLQPEGYSDTVPTVTFRPIQE